MEAEDLIAKLKEATEKERREKQGQTQAGLSPKKLGNSHETETASKLADIFNTNRTYEVITAYQKDPNGQMQLLATN